jgi:predicted nuclease with RNAse H fold
MAESQIVAGIDVGCRKGFHAVALRDGIYLDKFEAKGATAVTEVAAWCRKIKATIIGVDAPCRWSLDGHARLAERDLMREGIRCFASPIRQVAETHPTGYYDWILAGAKLFDELEKSHHLFSNCPAVSEGNVCFETFPHAIACTLADRILKARQRNKDRRALLLQAAIVLPPRSVIDTVDAALCALTARYLADNRINFYGEPKTGFIIVPGIPSQDNHASTPGYGKEANTPRRCISWQAAVNILRQNGHEDVALQIEEYRSTNITKQGWDGRLKKTNPVCWALVFMCD